MILRPGDRGEQVRQLQRDLEAAGFPCGAVDGIYGVRTADAVRALQAAHGLAVDGLFGPQSMAALADVTTGTLSSPDRASEQVDAPDGWAGPPWADVSDGGGDDWQGPPWADDQEDPGHDEDHDDDQAATDPPGIPEEFPAYFDNWDGELARRWRPDFYTHEASGRQLPFKGRPNEVRLSDRTHICMHVTAVEFGTASNRRRAWRQRIEGGDLGDDTIARYDDGRGDVEAMATRMALHERFWNVAYHWVGLLNGDVLFNNAPERYTYHGNSSNSFALGFSAEAKVPGRESRRLPEHTVVDDHFIETNRAALRLAITTSRDAGAPISHITAHRAFSMTREGDPGEAVWREVALPVARELDVEVDHDLVDGGRPIPRDWDPASPYDWAGSKLD